MSGDGLPGPYRSWVTLGSDSPHETSTIRLGTLVEEATRVPPPRPAGDLTVAQGSTQ